MEMLNLLPDAAIDDEQLRLRLASLNRLLEVTRILAAEIDTDRILESIAREACRALSCDRASLFQYDAYQNELFTRVATQLEIAEIRLGLDQGISGFVARNRVLANIANPQSDPRWSPTVDLQTGYTTRNMLAAPLTSSHDNTLLGVLQLMNKFEGDFDAFDEQVLLAFSQHAAVALDRARLVDELRRKQYREVSLKAAREVQRGFMPDVLPQIPGYEVATWWFPHEEVGGDYCDVLPLRDGRTALVVADVSGHGLGPSLIMASVRAALRALTLEHSQPELLLGMLGEALSQDLQDGRFITMILACLDPQKHTVEFANAGHAPAEFFHLAGNSFHSLEATGVPLGVLDRPDYPQGPPIQLEPGDLVVLGTDGIVEAMNDQSEQFGLSRLCDIVRASRQASVKELVCEIGRHVSSHFMGTEPSDDLTVLAVKRLY